VVVATFVTLSLKSGNDDIVTAPTVFSGGGRVTMDGVQIYPRRVFPVHSPSVF
jgi:hypothetical protein